jgi:hypothetical protein
MTCSCLFKEVYATFLMRTADIYISHEIEHTVESMFDLLKVFPLYRAYMYVY